MYFLKCVPVLLLASPIQAIPTSNNIPCFPRLPTPHDINVPLKPGQTYCVDSPSKPLKVREVTASLAERVRRFASPRRRPSSRFNNGITKPFSGAFWHGSFPDTSSSYSSSENGRTNHTESSKNSSSNASSASKSPSGNTPFHHGLSGVNSTSTSVSNTGSGSSGTGSSDSGSGSPDTGSSGTDSQSQTSQGTGNNVPPASSTQAAIQSSFTSSSLPLTNSSSTSTGTNATAGNSTGSTFGPSYRVSVTGYGGNCAGQFGACGFLGNPTSYQAAVSAYWNSAGQPGQCGTCWLLQDGIRLDGNQDQIGSLGTAPIVIMIDNTCAPDPSKGPDGLCNQNAGHPKGTKFGNVADVDLCADTKAGNAFFGKYGATSPGEDGQEAGLALGTITQVNCGTQWKGSIGQTASWDGYTATPGQKDAVAKKPAAGRR